VYLFAIPYLLHSKHCSKETGTKPWQDQGAHGQQKSRHKLRRDYWEATLGALRDSGDTLYQNISAGKDHWLSAGSGLSSCPYALIFAKSEIRVEFTFGRGSAEENKWLFDRLIEKKDQIEAAFGNEIHWLRLDDKKASRLQFGMPCEGYNRENWPEYVGWHVEHMRMWEAALRDHITSLNQALKARGGAS
jgi:hypothetical protein